MSRLIAFVAVALLAVPAYGQCGLFGGRSYSPAYSYGGCAPVMSYGCGSYVAQPTYYYGGCGTSVRSYVVQSSDCCGTTSSAVQKAEVKQSTPLPPDYYDPADPDARPITPLNTEEPTPAQEPEPEPELAEPPVESFQATSYKPTSIPVQTASLRKGDAILELHVSPTAQIWINGKKTQQMGSVRRYISKDLLEGKRYTYQIAINDNGRKGSGKVVLTAGQTKVLK